MVQNTFCAFGLTSLNEITGSTILVKKSKMNFSRVSQIPDHPDDVLRKAVL